MARFGRSFPIILRAARIRPHSDVLDGAADSSLTLTGTAAGERVHDAAGAGTATFTGAAIPNSDPIGQADAVLVLTGVAAGEIDAGDGTLLGAAAASVVLTGSGAVVVVRSSGATASTAFSSTASPDRLVYGATQPQLRLTGSALGSIFIAGAALLTTPAGTISDDDLLNAAVASQAYTYRFELLDAAGQYIGDLAVDRDNPPSITNDSTRTIRRTLENVRILPRPRHATNDPLIYADDVALDVLRQRVRVSMVLETGNIYELGTFWWADDSRAIATTGLPHFSSLVDAGIVLSQSVDRTIAFSDSSNLTVSEAIVQVANELGITNLRIHPTDVGFAAPTAFVPGRDTFLTVLESCCALLSYLPPYFDNTGALVARPAPDPGAGADLRYGAGTRVVRDSILISSTLLQAPNRYIVVDSAALEEPIVGVYDIPSDAPHSYANRGVRITRTDTVQGLTDQIAANQAAYAAYVADTSAAVLLSFDSVPDPRHDTFTTFDFDDEVYQELRWTLELRPGGRMSHEARAVYASASI